MNLASSLQLILAFALSIGVLMLAGGSMAAPTAKLSNLFPLFAEHTSPVACVISILAITLVAPWFGRSALGWIVDMSAMGTAA